MDIGHLQYAVNALVPHGFTPGGSNGCPRAAYTRSTLEIGSGEGHHAAEGVLTDASRDIPSDQRHLVTVTVDLSVCAGGTLPDQRPFQVSLSAKTSSLPTDSTAQTFVVESTR